MQADAQHEVIGIIEFVKTIADVEIGLSHDVDLQGQDLIEALEIVSAGIDEIVANAEVDGEVRHDKLRTGRDAESHFLVPRC